MPQIAIVVTGRVQGVGFRAFTRETADRLGIDGAVWNTREGNVEALASHEDPAVLDRFCELLESGPGYVREVHRAGNEGAPLAPGFEIRPTV